MKKKNLQWLNSPNYAESIDHIKMKKGRRKRME